MNLEGFQLATFAGGCFWCMVKPFVELTGVIKVESGYTGGNVENPTYEDVCSKKTGHFEAVQVTFDPLLVSYNQLLDTFWKQIDPTNPAGQFFDIGQAYRTAVFYHSNEQKALAENSKALLEKSNRFSSPIVTEILPAMTFYPAEEYHQNYYKKFPLRYGAYRQGSGRDAFLAEHWGKDNDKHTDLIKSKLSNLQYHVTQEKGTEPPFQNEYWDNYREGIYVDVISGEPLFSSKDKFDSGCGWPSFSKPIQPEVIKEKPDFSYLMKRTEVISFNSKSHLGHVFEDGPKERGGLRYCINSAALRFIPKEALIQEGYEDYLKWFDSESK